MSTTGYIVVAWVGTFLAVGVYALWVLQRGRALSKQVAPEQRRWMKSTDTNAKDASQ